MRGRPGPGEEERRPARGPFCPDPLHPLEEGAFADAGPLSAVGLRNEGLQWGSE